MLTAERDIDLFYQPHDATMLEDGRLMMIDDGNDRPGCVPLMDYKGCFSRAVIYALDIDNQKAHLEWQLEMPPYHLGTNLGAVRAPPHTAGEADDGARWGGGGEGGDERGVQKRPRRASSLTRSEVWSRGVVATIYPAPRRGALTHCRAPLTHLANGSLSGPLGVGRHSGEEGGVLRDNDEGPVQLVRRLGAETRVRQHTRRDDLAV